MYSRMKEYATLKCIFIVHMYHDNDTILETHSSKFLGSTCINIYKDRSYTDRVQLKPSNISNKIIA